METMRDEVLMAKDHCCCERCEAGSCGPDCSCSRSCTCTTCGCHRRQA